MIASSNYVNRPKNKTKKELHKVQVVQLAWYWLMNERIQSNPHRNLNKTKKNCNSYKIQQKKQKEDPYRNVERKIIVDR